MTEIRARVDAVVRDPATAEALKPWYRQLCKRPCFHDEYLQAFNEPGAHLVDTDGQGVERIDETGVWAGGTHYELDCLIFASGFEVGHRLRPPVRLRDHRAAAASRCPSAGTTAWSALHGMHVHGFPNLFIVGSGAGRQPDLQRHQQPGRRRARRSPTVVAHALADGRRRGRGHRGGRGAPGSRRPGERRRRVLRQPRLHARLLQQRGPAGGPARARWARSATRAGRWRSSTTSTPGAARAPSRGWSSARRTAPHIGLVVSTEN